MTQKWQIFGRARRYQVKTLGVNGQNEKMRETQKRALVNTVGRKLRKAGGPFAEVNMSFSPERLFRLETKNVWFPGVIIRVP